MRERNEFKIDRVAYRAEEGVPLPTETLQARRTGLLSRGVVMGVMASLLLMLGMLAAPAPAHAEVAVGISVSFGPPALPVYAQPLCPGPGYIWAPGYWAYDPYYGYYWVPGTWVMAPFIGALWTPGYWGFSAGLYYWHPGYWGPRVGYYGGVVYGFGYTGYGYHGGYWRQNRFYYNRAVNNIHITNNRYYYNQRVVDVRHTRVSYNGGPGGINARATSAELRAARERRFGPLDRQTAHVRDARNNPALRATVNRGRPDIAATPRPGDFKGRGVQRATQAGATYREPAHRAAPVERRNTQAAPARNNNPSRAERSAPVRREVAPRAETRNEHRVEQPSHTQARPQNQNRSMNRAQERPNQFQARPQVQNRPSSHAQPRPTQNRAQAPQVHRSTGHASQERAAHPPHSVNGGGNGHRPGGR